jgi:hypothetical protein
MYLSEVRDGSDLNIKEYGWIVKKNMKDFGFLGQFKGFPEVKRIP